MDRGRPGGVVGDPHRSHGGCKKHVGKRGDEDGVGQVKAEWRWQARGGSVAGAQSLEGVEGHGGGRTRIDIERSHAWRSMQRRFAGLSSKPGAWSEDAWRHQEACLETKHSGEGAGSVRCTNEKLDHFALRG